MNPTVKKILRTIGYTILGIVVLLVVAVMSLRLPAVQDYLRGHLVTYLEKKIKTKVSLDRALVTFPNNLIMENLYVQGRDVDTLLFVRKFDVQLNIPALLNNRAELTSIDLEGTRANVIRYENGGFNFDYIVDAFVAKEKHSTESKPFILSLDKIKLQDIGVSFIDRQAANDLNVYFKDFKTTVRKFDLDQNTYALGEILMDGLRLRVEQDLVKEVADKVDDKVDSLRQQKPLRLDLSTIKFTNFNIDYGDANSRTYAKVLFKELNADVRGINFEKNIYSVAGFALRGAHIDADIYSPPAPNEPDNPDARNDNGEPLRLELGDGVLDGVTVKYNNTAIARQSRGFDANHLDFAKLNLHLKNFKMDKDLYTGRVESAEIAEASGIDIRRFTTDFEYSEKQAFLRNLLLQTPGTLLRDNIELQYNSIAQLSSNPGAVRINANLRNSQVAFKDILAFAPQLRNTAPFNTYPNGILKIDAGVTGAVDDLMIHRLRLVGLDRTVVLASGRIQNATHPDKLYFDLRIPELSSTARTVNALLPKGTLPSNISLPREFHIRGTAKGYADNLNADLNLRSTSGNAHVIAAVDMRRKGAELYNVRADLQQLQLGQILGNKDLGVVTANISAKGQSFDFERGSAVVSGNVQTLHYNGYTYHNMNLNGRLNRGAYNVILDSKDPNANAYIAASGVYRQNNPTIDLKGDLRKVDLQRLGFYKDPLILAGKIDANFTNINPDYLNGHLYLDNFAISDTKEVYPLQQVKVEAVSTADSNSLVVNSQVLDFEMNGRYKLTQIGDALKETIDDYYHLKGPKKRVAPNQHFTFTGKVKDDDLIRKFVPELKSFATIDLSGNFDADTHSLRVHAGIPQVIYGSNEINDAVLDVNSNGALNYSLTARELKSESLALNKLSAAGAVQNDVITYEVTTKDDKDATQYLIAGNAKSLGDITEVSLDEQGLVLNYSNWTVAPGNQLRISSRGIVADNFAISHNGSRIALQSETQNPAGPLDVAIENFKIETIAEIVRKDSLPAAGTINGTAQLRNLTGNMTFNADMNISDLRVYGSAVGDVRAKVANKTADVLAADIRLTGNDNDASITGDYNTKASSFDLDLDLRRLQMASLQGFTGKAIQNAEGYLSGHLDVTGSTKQPNIRGALKFNDVGLEITETGSNFRHIDDEVRFTGRGIEFNRFRLKDPDGNALVINGAILTTDYSDFNFALTARANDFKVVDSEKDNDKLMYGVLAIDADLRIGGDLDLPKVDGTLAVTDKTDFTFVLPQTSPTLQDRQGIVEFIDKDQVALNQTLKADSLSGTADVRGLDVSVNIDIVKEAKISLLIDKANGDFVKLQGTAQLTGGIDPSGKTTLVGVYEVEEGAYELSVSALRRKFDIQKGSTITWTGEPTAADVDVTAVYRTETAPLDLVQQQLAGLSNAEINQFKQRIPFYANLKLGGELMKPVIDFDITMDDKNPNVPTNVLDLTEAKLEQLRTEPSELNKQVFALLLLNRFVGENPFDSETGLSAESMARQSVSRILSEQLNDLASDLIAGVDINFDLQSTEDYTMGDKNTRTDLNVGVSKRLLNDRLKVSVGSNFNLEGQERQNERATNIAGDIAVDYMLSKDGRYMLRFYRTDQYQVALQGQVIETGVSFIITLDYNKFQDILRNQKENKDLRRQNREIRRNDRKRNK